MKDKSGEKRVINKKSDSVIEIIGLKILQNTQCSILCMLEYISHGKMTKGIYDDYLRNLRINYKLFLKSNDLQKQCNFVFTLIPITSKNTYITKQSSNFDQLFSQYKKALNTNFILL